MIKDLAALVESSKKREREAILASRLFVFFGVLGLLTCVWLRFKSVDLWASLDPAIDQRLLWLLATRLAQFEALRVVALAAAMFSFVLAGLVRYGQSDRRLLIALAQERLVVGAGEPEPRG